MTASWQLVLLWGVLVGLGTGSMALSLVATVTGRWFVARRGLVSGVLTAGGAAGQLIFLPLVAAVDAAHGWRAGVAGHDGRRARRRPAGGLAAARPPARPRRRRPTAGRRPTTSTRCAPAPRATPSAGWPRPPGRRPFWLLAGGFFICGMSTNGLVQPHFIPAAHDHGMPVTTAAALLAVVGLFDIAGTIFSGWLTDRVDPRLLLLAYYALRGLSLFLLPSLFAPGLARQHGRVHRLLRPGLGGHRAADAGAVPASTSAPGRRSCSAGCSPPTSSARRSRRSAAA